MESTQNNGHFEHTIMASAARLLATELSAAFALVGWASFDGPLKFVSLLAGTIGAVFFCLKLFYDFKQSRRNFNEHK